MDLLKLLTGAINDLVDAKHASDAEAEAAALAALDAKLAEIAAGRDTFAQELAAARAAGEEAHRKKFHPDNT